MTDLTYARTSLMRLRSQVGIVSQRAKRVANISITLKVSVIILGALAATQGAAEAILGPGSVRSILTLYTFIGLAIAAIGVFFPLGYFIQPTT